MNLNLSSSVQNYDMSFTVAGRTLIRKRFRIVHMDAFRSGLTEETVPSLPTSAGRADGMLLHSVMASEGTRVRRQGNWIVYVLDRYPRHFTDLSGSFEDFFTKLSSKTRSTLKRKVNRLARESGGAIDWRVYETGKGMRDFLDQCRPLVARTYQARLFDGALPNDSEFAEKAIAAAERGEACGYLLFLRGEPIAYLYTPFEEDRFIYSYVGFDPDYSWLSPGTVLQYLVHQRLFAEHSEVIFDFSEGDGPHKRLFATHSENCATILCLKSTLTNALLVRSHLGWNGAIAFLRDRLAGSRLGGWLKARIRGTG